MADEPEVTNAIVLPEEPEIPTEPRRRRSLNTLSTPMREGLLSGRCEHPQGGPPGETKDKDKDEEETEEATA